MEDESGLMDSLPIEVNFDRAVLTSKVFKDLNIKHRIKSNLVKENPIDRSATLIRTRKGTIL